MIKKGDKIIVKKCLQSVLDVLNYNKGAINYMKKYINNKYTVEAVWYDKGQYYIVIDKSIDIPIQCCREVK